MRFEETELAGAFLVRLEPHVDTRGFFARTFCEEEFAARGLPTRFPQCNLSRNARAGTLRGMHYNAAPHREAKLVRCTAGAIWDVIVDMRAGSPTRLRWVGVELDAERQDALFIPEGFAHGFITLRDGTDVTYQMGRAYVAGAARGLRWDEPRLGIRWPRPPAVLSERDATWPALDEAAFDG
jgi:dTDP-4-dehydrorhamnose 3,5-epimerase